MKNFMSYLGRAYVVAGFLMLYGCASAKSDWVKVKDEGTVQAHEAFIHKHPSSQEAIQARVALQAIRDDLAWKEADRLGTPKAYEDYLAKYRSGTHEREARSHIDARTWEISQREGTLEAYWDYLEKNPKGEHVSDAGTQIDRLTYEAASQKQSIGALRDYIQFSKEGRLSGRFVPHAEARVKELVLRAVVLSDAAWADVIERMHKLAAPFSLWELYVTCTQQLKNVGGKAINYDAKRQPGKIPVMSTVVIVEVGKRVRVSHLEGTYGLSNMLGVSSEKEQLVLTLSNPSTDLTGGIGFEDIEMHTVGNKSQRYIRIDTKYYLVN